MDITPLSMLQTPDEQSRHFAALGFQRSEAPAAEIASEEQQQLIAVELIDCVPEMTRRAFEQLRTLFRYGILCFDNFSAVQRLAPLTIDLALRERFIHFYANGISAVDSNGERVTLPVRSVTDLLDQLKAQGLNLVGWTKGNRFRGGFGQLNSWARAQGLLPGQRARWHQDRLEDWRNYLAHPDGMSLATPWDAARDIRQVAEIVNQLWGEPTVDGRVYRGPVPREVVALASRVGESLSVGLVSSLLAHAELQDAQITIARAVLNDDELDHFDARFERTWFPVTVLFDGSYADALGWMSASEPTGDDVTFTDRLFVIRRDEQGQDVPRSPRQFRSLDGIDREGEWYLVRADHPQDATVHVQFAHRPFIGECSACAATGMTQGSWVEVDLHLQSGSTDR